MVYSEPMKLRLIIGNDREVPCSDYKNDFS